MQTVDRILCAAIWFDDGVARSHQSVPTGYVACGLRHCNIMHQPRSLRTCPRTCGFLTSAGLFVDRKAALAIAVAAGQLEGRVKHHPLDQLTSEDLY